MLPCAKVLVSEYITIGLQKVVDVLVSLPTNEVIELFFTLVLGFGHKVIEYI